MSAMHAQQASCSLAGWPASQYTPAVNSATGSYDTQPGWRHEELCFWYSTIIICSCKATAQSAPQQAVERVPCVLCSSLRTRETKQIRSGKIRLLRLLPADEFNKSAFRVFNPSSWSKHRPGSPGDPQFALCFPPGALPCFFSLFLVFPPLLLLPFSLLFLLF